MNAWKILSPALALALVVMCVSGCRDYGPRDESKEESVSANENAAPDPQMDVVEEGGSLYANMSAEPQTLNPLTSRDVYASIVQDDIFESLLERDPDTLKFKGRLAEAWNVSEDGLKITFHINPKARFADGRPVTADDVIFTYATFMNPKIDAQRLATYFKDCAGVERVDELTVRFIWKKPYFKSLEVSGTFYPVLP